jgi:hypothetical protein
METTLTMVFKNGLGKNASLSLKAPREDLDGAEVAQAMQDIIDADVFTSGGEDLVGIVAARIVARQVTELELA